jgi:nucleoside-diphosphate-sugar epimerase
MQASITRRITGKYMQRVVITGANGFVGSNMVRDCLARGCKVTGLVRDKADHSLLPAGFRTTSIDYWDVKELQTVLAGNDILVHNAAITRGRNWEEFKRYNIELTTNILKVANEIDSLKQFVFISSQAASGECFTLSGKREDEECFPVSYYGKSKLLAETNIVKYCQKDWTIIRPASVFGPGDSDFLQYFKLVKRGISLLIGFRPRYISLIPVSGLTELVFRTFGNPKAYGEIFFASCSSYYSWDEFINALESAMNRKTTRIRIPELFVYPVALIGELKGKLSKRQALINLQKLREMKGKSWICDAGKAKKYLGFELQDNLEEELHKTYEWYREKGWL